MKFIISGTDRTNSKTRKIAHIVQNLYREQGEETTIVDLEKLPISSLNGKMYGAKLPGEIAEIVDQFATADGIIFVCPEYNGSMPGVLKYFMDFWRYPETFENRPFCFIGIGGRFGGLRPIEHLQQIVGYRNGYVFPNRVFIMNVMKLIEGEKLNDEFAINLMKEQVRGFQKFTAALNTAGLHANQLNQKRT